MKRIIMLSALVVLMGRHQSGWASCGSASCPLDTRSERPTSKGTVEVGYEFSYIDQDQPRIGRNKAAVGEIRGHHDEVRTLNRLHRLTGTMGLTDRLSLDLALPVVSRQHRHVHNHHGSPIPDGWDFTGVGDLSVQGGYAFYKPADLRRPTLSGIVGAEFPTGKSHLLNDDGDEAESGITPGSASYDVFVGGSSLQAFSMPTLTGLNAVMPVFGSITYKINGKGHEDYRLGNVFSANAGATYPLYGWLGLSTQVNLLVKTKDGRGETSEEVGKTGGEFLYVSPGLLLRLGSPWELHAIVQVPVYQRVNEIQITSAYNLLTRLAYRFKA